MPHRQLMKASAAIPGAPAAEIDRSPATRRIGEMAAARGLRMMHFEHRAHLPSPTHWDQAPAASTWRGGVLHEHKYASFRHDLLLGSFHPGHRGKWTGHELCHGVVGFAWRPGASRLWHALAAQLAEVLPVALWYFLDEEGLGRCPRHRWGGALHRTFCLACERAATEPSQDVARPGGWAAAAERFVMAELEAVKESRRIGRLTSHAHGALDLAMDGLRYAEAHHGRLQSEAFHRLTEIFFGEEKRGRHDTLDAFEATILGILKDLLGQTSYAPAALPVETGVAQDIGWRLLKVREECDGPAAAGILTLVERLGTVPGALEEVIEGYESLHGEWHLPDPADVFAVGYPLPGGYGSALGQLAEGIRSACPGAATLLGLDLEDAVKAFATQDLARFERLALGRRFARWLLLEGDGPTAALARFEAAIGDPRPLEEVSQRLGPGTGPWRLSEAVEILRAPLDVLGLADAVEAGENEIDVAGLPSTLAVLGSGSDGVSVVPLSEVEGALLEGLSEGCAGDLDSALDEGRLNALTEAGVLVPSCWELDAPTAP